MQENNDTKPKGLLLLLFQGWQHFLSVLGGILDNLGVTWNSNIFKRKCDFHIDEESLTFHFTDYISFSEKAAFSVSYSDSVCSFFKRKKLL